MTSAAQLRALEGVAPRLWRERDHRHTLAALRQLEVPVGADDVEAVRRVVAAQADLERRARLGLDLRRREAESLGRDFHYLARWVGLSRRRHHGGREQRNEEGAHQNHHPRPRLKELGAWST